MKNIEITSDGWGSRYLEPFTSASREWDTSLEKAQIAIKRGGIAVLVGKRGTGKTQLAAELSRSGEFPDNLDGKEKTSCYRRAMEMLVAIRDASHNGQQGEIILGFSRVGILIIDEFHERGETEWENRVITTIIDRRYADRLPTVIIGNIEPAAIQQSLSASVISRMHESGGLVVLKNETFR